MDADSDRLRARSSHPVGAKVVRLLALLFNALVQTLKPAVDAGRDQRRFLLTCAVPMTAPVAAGSGPKDAQRSQPLTLGQLTRGNFHLASVGKGSAAALPCAHPYVRVRLTSANGRKPAVNSRVGQVGRQMASKKAHRNTIEDVRSESRRRMR